MIISASRRTDIPAFFSSWFMERIREGNALVKNPFNPSRTKTVSLRPEDVDAIVFWTRNSEPLMKHLKELDDRGYNYIFLYTITGYGPPLEKKSPSLEKALEIFKKLSQKIGPEKNFWRFDPIVYVSGKGEEWIASCFNKIARSLRNETQRVIVSFLDFYPKVVKRLKTVEKECGFKVIDITHQNTIVGKIAATLAELATTNNMEIFSCAEKEELAGFGIQPGSCIDGKALNRLFGRHLIIEKDKSQRPQCRCTTSQDIGEYRTCRHGCVYCYAL
jgi:DNA repair photolyase